MAQENLGSAGERLDALRCVEIEKLAAILFDHVGFARAIANAGVSRQFRITCRRLVGRRFLLKLAAYLLLNDFSLSKFLLSVSTKDAGCTMISASRRRHGNFPDTFGLAVTLAASSSIFFARFSILLSLSL